MESIKNYPVFGNVFTERSTPMSKSVGVNLVNNPRNVVSDSINKSQSGTNPNKNLAFSSVSKFTYKVEEHKRLLKKNYPFGMLNAEYSHTNFNLDLILKDCKTFTKLEQKKVTTRLTKLIEYLNKIIQEYNYEDLLAEKLVIDLMPDSPEKDSLMDVLLEQINSINIAHKEQLQSKIDEIALKLLTLKNSLQQPLKDISKIYEEKADSTLLGNEFTKQNYKWSQRELSARTLINEINQQMYDAYLVQEQLLYANMDLLQLKDNYTGIVLQINADESPRTFSGWIPKLEDDLFFHTKWIETNPEIELVSITKINKSNYTPYLGQHWQNKYGTAGFWGCEMLSYKPNTVPMSGGLHQNIKDPDRLQYIFLDGLLTVSDTTETFLNPFTDEISIKDSEDIFVVFNIIRNKYPLNYTRFDGTKFYSSQTDRDKNYSYDVIMTSKDSLYLQQFLLDSVEQKEIEFHSAIQVKHKDYYDNNEYTEELTRNLYVNLKAIHETINTICAQPYIVESSDSIMRKNINQHVKNVELSYLNRQRFYLNNSYRAVRRYYDKNPTQQIKEGIISEPLSKNISDVYLQLGISLLTKHSASAHYIYKFFTYLASISKVSKEDFYTYQSRQTQDITTNPVPYKLSNYFKLSNKIIENLLEYSYINIETLPDTWEASGQEYLNGIPHKHYKGFCMLKIVSKPKKLIVYSQYTQFNYANLLPKLDYFGRYADAWSYLVSVNKDIQYEESILEIYLQTSEYEYSKVSVHGLKQTITRRPGYLLLPQTWVLFSEGIYATESFEYIERRKISDITENTLTGYVEVSNETANIFIKDNEDHNIELIPTIRNNLSSFIIPLWDHQLDDSQYNDKKDLYGFNTIESVYQDSLNLLVFADLSDKQLDALGDDSYWVAENRRDKVLTAYLDNFISKYSLDQKEVKYSYLYKSDNDYPKDEVYNDLMFNIGTAPNVSAYLVVPPNPFNGNFMTAMQRVSTTLSSQQMNNKTTFHFESLNLKNKIFGDVQNNKFKFK